MNDLQKQNATLKRVNAPSDDPVGNVKLMSIRNETLDNEQFERNANLAKTFLNYTDSSLEELTNLLGRAKELAIGQASSAANGAESRMMVAEEVRNILNEASSIANRRLGERHIFAGYMTHSQPFDDGYQYRGDDGNIMVEVQKDVFVGMNIPGKELFLGANPKVVDPQNQESSEGLPGQPELAMSRPTSKISGENLFDTLEALRVGLMTNDVDQIRATLEPLDRISNRVITTRAQVGARTAGIDTAIANMGKKNVFNAELQSGIEDADVIQVVSDMAREESVLRASLQASNKLIQPTLLEFLK